MERLAASWWRADGSESCTVLGNVAAVTVLLRSARTKHNPAPCASPKKLHWPIESGGGRFNWELVGMRRSRGTTCGVGASSWSADPFATCGCPD